MRDVTGSSPFGRRPSRRSGPTPRSWRFGRAVLLRGILGAMTFGPAFFGNPLHAAELPQACRERTGVLEQWVELIRYPASSTVDLLSGPGVGVEVDAQRTEDGDGALRVTYEGDRGQFVWRSPLRLAGRLDGQLLVEARIRTADFEGKPKLIVRWGPNLPRITRQSMTPPRTGGWRWLRLVTPVPEEKANELRVAVELAGAGTVWVDQVRLITLPAEVEIDFRTLSENLEPTYGLAEIFTGLSSRETDEMERLVPALDNSTGAEPPLRVQRCVVETYLDQMRRMHENRGKPDVVRRLERLARRGPQFPFALFYKKFAHRYYLPEYLESLVAAGPTEELAKTFGAEMTEPLVQWAEAILEQEMPPSHTRYFGPNPESEEFNTEVPNPSFARRYEKGIFDAAQSLLDAEGEGSSGMSANQKEMLRAVCERHLGRLTDRELLYSTWYHSLFRVLSRLDSELIVERLPALMEERLATRDYYKSQFAELTLLAELRMAGGREILSAFRELEESPEVRERLDLLLEVHAGKAELPAGDWSRYREIAWDSPAVDWRQTNDLEN